MQAQRHREALSSPARSADQSIDQLEPLLAAAKGRRAVYLRELARTAWGFAARILRTRPRPLAWPDGDVARARTQGHAR